MDSHQATHLFWAGLPNLLSHTFAAKHQWITTNLVAAREQLLHQQGTITGPAVILSHEQILMQCSWDGITLHATLSSGFHVYLHSSITCPSTQIRSFSSSSDVHGCMIGIS
eukprot:scaffold74156_cov74-Attheya_sp.AAC.3